jgi:hypothetical protein
MLESNPLSKTEESNINISTKMISPLKTIEYPPMGIISYSVTKSQDSEQFMIDQP